MLIKLPIVLVLKIFNLIYCGYSYLPPTPPRPHPTPCPAPLFLTLHQFACYGVYMCLQFMVYIFFYLARKLIGEFSEYHLLPKENIMHVCVCMCVGGGGGGEGREGERESV